MTMLDALGAAKEGSRELDRQIAEHIGWKFSDDCEGWDSDPSGIADAGWQHMAFVGKAAAGRLLDGREWREFPG